MVFSLLPSVVSQILCFAVAFGYPAVKTLRLLGDVQDEGGKIDGKLTKDVVSDEFNPSAMAADTAVSPTATTTKSRISTDNVTSDYVHWLIYWLLFCGYDILEYQLKLAINFVPLYYELKCAFFFWLGHEYFQGAAYIWYGIAAKYYKQVDTYIMKQIKTHFPNALKWLHIEH